MHALLLIALNTFKETIRNKVLYNILLFAVVIIALSISFGEWSVFARTQVMEDFGLATMSISGLLLAAFIGVGMLGREISQKTLYTVLVKPVERWHFLIGKFIGLLFTLFLNFLVMSAVFAVTLKFLGGNLSWSLGGAILLLWVELAVIIAVAVLFSTITTPTLGAMFTLGFYLIGHYNDLLDIQSATFGHEWYTWFLKMLYYLLPNLEHFNIRTQVIYGSGTDIMTVGMGCVYGGLFCILFLIVAGIVFSRRDL